VHFRVMADLVPAIPVGQAAASATGVAGTRSYEGLRSGDPVQ